MPTGTPPSLAVLIPTHRRPDRLARTLKALDHARAQTPFDVHVADSTPEEDLRGRVREACAPYAYVSLTQHPGDFGFAQKLNFMAREAAAAEGIQLERRPIDRSELYIADELGLTGTLAEITPIKSIDEQALPEEAPILSALERRYREAVMGTRPHPAVELNYFPG